MKTLFLFTDTETTGITKKEHKLFSPYMKEQVLSYALVLYDKEKCLLEEEVKIKLKKNVLPNPSALLVNNLNPFSKEFLSVAVSEYEGAHYFVKKIQDYKDQGYRVIFIAYNAEYDRNLFFDMFTRCGINFDAVVDSIFDPLLMTRQLVKEGRIKTREVEGFGGKKWNSSSLEDVYKGLGFSTAAITAHNALEDTKMLKSVTYKAYMLFTGKNFEEADIDETTFTVNEEKTVMVLEEHEAKVKNIKILKTNKTGKILVLDHDKVKESPEKVKSCVVELNVSSILDEMDFRMKESNELESFYNQNKTAIDDIVNKYELVDSMFFNNESLYFGAVEKLAEKLMKDPAAELDEKEQSIVELAEEYSYARYNDGWTVKLKGPNHENDPKEHVIKDDLVLVLDPVGKFVLKESADVILTSEKKAEVIAEVVKRTGFQNTDPEYKRVSVLLVPVKSFKSAKYPADLIKEFNEKKTLVFNGANKLHKDTLRDLKEYFQSVNKEAFKELTIPDFKLNLNIFKK